MTDAPDNPVSKEMQQYLPVFMDETEEQLEGLTETLLVLEREPDDVQHLNEAFRLIHSIKGASGMMGLDSIATLTHHLESRFERFRSGVQRLDRPTMDLVLRCIDFLRECIGRLRAGSPLGSSGDLLEEIIALEQAPAATADADVADTTGDTVPADAQPTADVPSAPPVLPAGEGRRLLLVCFDPELPLVDLKARLILSRLSGIGDVVASRPSLDELDGIDRFDELHVVVETEQDDDALRAVADVDGVRSIDVTSATAEAEMRAAAHRATPHEAPQVTEEIPATTAPPETAPAEQPVQTPAPERAPAPTAAARVTPAPVVPAEPAPVASAEATPPETAPAPARVPPRKIAETMRVDIERLDSLMNLAGELVVNRARLVEVTNQLAPAFGRRNVMNRTREFGETLRRTIEHLEATSDGQWTSDIEELKSGLDLLGDQAEAWDHGRRGFGQLGEAIDQLTRIADSFQQSVLDTRMVPVAPLFNRFKRVVRDLSTERGKQVDLAVSGEKTELDKRMIDDLGEPLVHLVRNAIDHGLEAPDVRLERGKSATGTITLEASHSGNNVFVRIRDDGGGLDVSRIKAKIAERGLLSATAADDLTDAQAIDYIWNPGFSTAAEVTDVSGRGVGMDAVRARIIELNGQVDVDSVPEQGTTFTIRLPLTLAIINSLLIRVRDIVFSMPIDDVREIVSVRSEDIVNVHGKQAVDVRGRFIPLVSMDDVFDWHDFGHEPGGAPARNGSVEAVILQCGDKTMGLRVDELLGSQDIVIKSLSKNFVHIRGLSGASILGDGSVSLMLDVPTTMELAANGARQKSNAGNAT